MSSRVSLAVTAGSSGSNLFGDAIGPGDDLDGMERDPPGLLGDGRVGEMAVAGDRLAAEAGDLVPQLLADRHGEIGVLVAQAPHSVDARALLDELHARPRELHQVAALEPDVLGAEVAGRVVRDALRYVAAEVEVEAGALLVQLREVLARVVGVFGHQPA